MFRIFLNEISLQGFPSDDALRKAVKALLAARRDSPNLARVLFCSSLIGEIQARPGERLLASLARLERDDKAAVLNWLAKKGPFFDVEYDEIDNNLFHLYGIEVTDLGAGEAARYSLRGFDGRLLSFTHRSYPDFSVESLPVVHGFTDAPLSIVAVPNIHDFSHARLVADAAEPEPTSWPGLLDVCRRKYAGLIISSYCDEVLSALTFYPAVSRRTIELLKVLNDLVSEMADDGSVSACGQEIIQSHFVGENAWFTDESDRNKRDFRTEMTFPDPTGSGKQLQCFWHGKIKTQQFRIHFEWPVPAGDNALKVAYIGPKISRR